MVIRIRRFSVIQSRNSSSFSSQASSSLRTSTVYGPEESEKSGWTTDEEKEPVKKDKVDHLGVPLSHPMAVTPFPGKTTPAKREKARKMLKQLAEKLALEQASEKAAGFDEKEQDSTEKKEFLKDMKKIRKKLLKDSKN